MSLDPAKLGATPNGYATVFDVGAFQGDFAYACHQAWPGAHVECFEPLLPNPDETPAARSEAFVGWVTWHQVALGAESGIQTMQECEFIPSSSLLPMLDLHKTAFPYASVSHPVDVPVDRLDGYAKLVRPPALLKIDVQGTELEVLRGAHTALDRFAAVVLEVSWAPLYEGAPTFDDLNGHLAGYGFVHSARIDEMPHPQTGALLQSDELWLR